MGYDELEQFYFYLVASRYFRTHDAVECDFYVAVEGHTTDTTATAIVHLRGSSCLLTSLS